MMKSIFSAVLLFAMALATLMTPLSHTSANVYGLDNTKVTEPLVHRQVDPMAYGSPCSDEGAWFCMSTTFQRCASGQWTMAQDCSPGTQCEPLGLTYNASQPAFGIYDGSSSSVTTELIPSSPGPITVTRTTNITLGPSGSQLESSAESTPSDTAATRTTTIYLTAPASQGATSSIVISSATPSSTSTTSSTSEPKADDTSDGAHAGGFSWSMMGMMSLCLAAGVWYNWR